MNNKEYGRILEHRTRKFAIEAIMLSKTLPSGIEEKIVRNQLTRSASSIGANYREANRSRSRADFKNKIRICESEASETEYWLDIITDLGWVTGSDIHSLKHEAGELLAIFTSIGLSLRNVGRGKSE